MKYTICEFVTKQVLIWYKSTEKSESNFSVYYDSRGLKLWTKLVVACYYRQGSHL